MNPEMERTGAFITFEGPDGSGKSTQIERLARVLASAGRPVITTREPGGTPLGEAIRGLLLGASGEGMRADTEVLLFCAARGELVDRVVAPALAQGRTVLCDRFADATVVYQGSGRGVDARWIAELNERATRGLSPDLTVLLDLPVEVGLTRKQSSAWNRLDGAGLAFHERVRQGYLALASAEPERWVVVRAHQPPEQVAEEILAAVTERLAARAGSV
jgi:dTMP kinase